jgi:hypothetical protein
MLSALLSSLGLKVPCRHGPECGVLMNSKGFFSNAVVSSTSLPVRSAPVSVSNFVGGKFGEGSELLGAPSSKLRFRVSSSELAIVCASRKLLGFIGACGLIF